MQEGEYADLLRFLRTWWSDDEYMQVQTSGSTGTPKQLRVSKTSMMQSARATCSFFGLDTSDTALLCMDLRYIGAMMLVVRCLVSGMKLIVRTPCSNPLLHVEEAISFTALVPLQAGEILSNEVSKGRLCQIKHVIIGGGSLDISLEDALSVLPNSIYSTYGMTETLSHIALRKVSGRDTSAYYSPLHGVSLSLSDRGTLCIDAPLIIPEPLETNDIADLCPDGRFRILGRSDNIINSGGIKIQLERVEYELSRLCPMPTALTWRPDRRLGQALVLVAEGESSDDETMLLARFKSCLPRYHCPKAVIYIPKLPRLPSGKLDRLALMSLAQTESK
ncbi:MAG: AMP-binding protein [Porphyromonadaceae bacterium]|nr:AMP-binding protein [Porphyromonadaceae bacterium]